MTRAILAAMLLALAGAPAGAATLTLAGTSSDGQGGTRFAYQADVGAQESLSRGSTLIIYDFAGYIDGSIFTSGADLIGSVELVSALPRAGGLIDDPTLVNLVFTYAGSPIRDLGGAFDFGGFGASSSSHLMHWSGVSTRTVKYDLFAGRIGSADWQGALLVPAPIPEPAAWAMMIVALGLAGAAFRLRRTGLAAA